VPFAKYKYIANVHQQLFYTVENKKVTKFSIDEK